MSVGCAKYGFFISFFTQEKEKENADEEPEEPEELEDQKKMKKPASKKAKSQATPKSSKLLKRPAAALGKKKDAAPTHGENQTEERESN